MSKSTMLRTRRKDANIKPNRSSVSRLDRKSSRGMIYENEELRLRTININAEVEKGQSDIKKLRRENEQLRREIWCLRDEYDKLDKLLKNKQSGSEHSSSCSSEEESDARSSCSCQSCETEETSQNQENVEKISNRQNLHVEFDHLSIVSEEKSPEKSDKSEENYFFDESNTTAIPTTAQGFIFPAPSAAAEKKLLLPLRPDQSYPINYNLQCHDKFSNDGAIYKTQPETTNLHRNVDDVKPKHFFSPLPTRKLDNAVATPPEDVASLNQFVCEKTGPDLYVDQMSVEQETVKRQTIDSSTATKASSNSPAFQTGGNLEELLQDIELISNDILQLSTNRLAHDNVDVVAAGGSNSKFASFQNQNDPNPRGLIVCSTPENVENCQKFVYIDSSITPDSSTFQDPRDEQYLGRGQKPYKSELNVVLMPNPMPLIGFEKYKIMQQSNPEISCGITLDENQTKILSVQNSTVNFNNQPVSSTATKTNLNNDFSLSLNALNSTPYLTAMFEQSKIHCPKCYNPFTTPFDVDKTIPTQNLFCQNCVQCELSLLQNQTAAIQNEIHSPPNYENYPIEIKPNTLNKNILQPDNQIQSVNNFETNLSETQTPKTSLKIATHGSFPLPVDFSNSTEINSPRIMKENFPSGQDSSSIRNIDDSNVDKLTTSSSDDRVLKKICDEIPKSPGKSRKMRKLSIHFNGNKSPVVEKYSRSLSLDCATEHKTNKNLLDFGPSASASSTPVKEPQRILPKFELKNIPENQELDSNSNKESVTTTTPTTPTTNFDRKMSKCASNGASEKKHVQHVKLDKAGNGNFVNGNERKHKHESSTKKRRKNSSAVEKIKNRFDQKSYSIDLGSRSGSRTFDRHDWPAKHYDSYNEFTTSLSERERTNSLTSESSRNTIKSRKLSGFTTFNSHGKVPWCGCWGNGCL